MTKFNKLITESVKCLLDENPCESASIGLAFSGGTDSSVLLFTLLSLGISPQLYTYCVQGQDSKDVRIAEKITKKLGLTLHVCSIPSGIECVIRDIKVLVNKYDIHGQMRIQCCQGAYSVAKKAKTDGIKLMFNGSGVDGIYGIYMPQQLMRWHKRWKEWQDSRFKHCHNPNDDAMMDQKRISENYGIDLVFPYRDSAFIAFLMDLTYEDMNIPRYKQIAVDAFRGYFDQTKSYRPRGSQQLIAGTKLLHQKLLTHPINKFRRKSMAKLYEDIAHNYTSQ